MVKYIKIKKIIVFLGEAIGWRLGRVEGRVEQGEYTLSPFSSLPCSPLSVSQASLPLDCHTQNPTGSRNDHHPLLPPPSSLLSVADSYAGHIDPSLLLLATWVIATYIASCWKMKHPRKHPRKQPSAGVRRSAKLPKVCFQSRRICCCSPVQGGCSVATILC